MNRTRRPDERRRIARLRRETLRVLGATELGGVVGAGHGIVLVADDGGKVTHEDQRIPTRYCVA